MKKQIFTHFISLVILFSILFLLQDKEVQNPKVKVYLRKYFYNISEFDFAIKLFVKGIKESSEDDVLLNVSLR